MLASPALLQIRNGSVNAAISPVAQVLNARCNLHLSLRQRRNAVTNCLSSAAELVFHVLEQIWNEEAVYVLCRLLKLLRPEFSELDAHAGREFNEADSAVVG